MRKITKDMIIITNTFSKNLKKLKSIWLENIKNEIEKHNSGLNNFIELIDLDWNKIYKWYLLSKKVRILTYFQKVWNKFIPFYIVNKETKYWYNITSNLEDFYLRQLDKSIEDIDSKKYIIYE